MSCRLSCEAGFTPILTFPRRGGRDRTQASPPPGEGSVACATGGDGGWRGVGVSRFLPAQERRRGGAGTTAWVDFGDSAVDWQSWATPRSYFDGAQHERPRTGEGRHETCPYGGGRGDWIPAPPLQRGALCVRRGVMGVGGRWVCRGSCLRRNDGLTGWRGAGLPPLALRLGSARAAPRPGRAGTRPAPTGDGDTSTPPLSPPSPRRGKG